MTTRNLLLTLLAFAMLWPHASHAVSFRRDILTVIPKPPALVVDEKGQPLKEQPEPRKSFRFYTELRDEGALQLDWVHSLNRISAERTMTIVFNQPTIDVLHAQNVYQPLDILAISPEGIIMQIVPNLLLSTLSQPIETARPARARLVLQGGAAAILELEVGDRIEHPIFQPAPEIKTQ